MTYFFGFLHRHEWEYKSKWESLTSEPLAGVYQVVNNVVLNTVTNSRKTFVNKEYICKECGEIKVKTYLKSEEVV